MKVPIQLRVWLVTLNDADSSKKFGSWKNKTIHFDELLLKREKKHGEFTECISEEAQYQE